MATNGSFTHQEQYKPAADPAAPGVADVVDSSSTNDLSKDEVGWYFVEQYYTTLSKSPDRIHLFYNKRSQFVSGIEAEVANVSVGRQAIQDRIKQLEFQDTKVRVSNVDSQASSDGIVIQVIGELSNKAAEPKKFVQTFVLAQQPTGYFVLNDMMRYINEEDNTEAADAPADQEPAAEEPSAVEPEKEEPAAAAAAPVASETGVVDPAAVEQKLEETQTTKDTPDINGGEAEVAEEAETPAIVVEQVDAEATARELAEEDASSTEKPQDPAPTPLEKPAAPAVEPVAPIPTGPPKPMTWASRAAAAAGPRPVVPLPQTATPPAQSQSRAPAPAAAPTAPAASSKPAESAAQPAANASTAPAAETPKDVAGWQTAGLDAKRQTRPQSISANVEKDGTLGYVKYVNEKVQDADLRKALEAHGDLAYFDINRQKNCAFVEYKSADALVAALSSNPHVVSGEQIVVEQRRPKTGPYGGFAGRGGSQRGRGGFDGSRTGGAPGGARGAFSGQSRGRGGARGRGNAQAPAA